MFHGPRTHVSRQSIKNTQINRISIRNICVASIEPHAPAPHARSTHACEHVPTYIAPPTSKRQDERGVFSCASDSLRFFLKKNSRSCSSQKTCSCLFTCARHLCERVGKRKERIERGSTGQQKRVKKTSPSGKLSVVFRVCNSVLLWNWLSWPLCLLSN